MIAIKHFLSWLALFCFGLVALQSTQHGVEAARLAATQAAREEAAMKLEQAKTPEELQKEKERMEKIKADIESLLNESKEYKQSRTMKITADYPLGVVVMITHFRVKKSQEEEVAEYSPKELEETELWRREYNKFMAAEKNKDLWEKVGVVSAITGAVSAGLAGFGKAHENAGGVAENPSAAKLVKGAGTVALLGGAAALISWLMRRHNKKREKLQNARLARMQFEARTGLKPSDQNVLGPEEDEILNPRKKKKEKKDED